MPADLQITSERLGLHHFAYLRALAEGLPVPKAAARYLHIDHARAARSAHRVVIERARALARRRGDPAWRLLAPLDADDWVLTGHQLLQVIDATERSSSDLATSALSPGACDV